MKPYEYYNATDGEQDHVHVEVLGKDSIWVHMTRIAEHGVENIIKDGGWYHAQRGKVTTARFVYNWGSGPTIEMTDGVVTKGI